MERGIFGKIKELSRKETEVEKAERILGGNIRGGDILRLMISMVIESGTKNLSLPPIIIFKSDLLEKELVRRSEKILLKSDNPNPT